jgi:hypothetical protein
MDILLYTIFSTLFLVKKSLEITQTYVNLIKNIIDINVWDLSENKV